MKIGSEYSFFIGLATPNPLNMLRTLVLCNFCSTVIPNTLESFTSKAKYILAHK